MRGTSRAPANRVRWQSLIFDPTKSALPIGLPDDLFAYSWPSGYRLADSTLTHYEYDQLGRLTSQTDGKQHTTTFDYVVEGIA